MSTTRMTRKKNPPKLAIMMAAPHDTLNNSLKPSIAHTVTSVVKMYRSCHYFEIVRDNIAQNVTSVVKMYQSCHYVEIVRDNIEQNITSEM